MAKRAIVRMPATPLASFGDGWAVDEHSLPLVVYRRAKQRIILGGHLAMKQLICNRLNNFTRWRMAAFISMMADIHGA